MGAGLRFAAGLAAALAVVVPASAEETPKRGGTLTYLVPADAPPSFDGHRETTYATVHAAAPFYSVLIRVDPMKPGSTDFVCDLCTEIPQPTDGGKTYTFKIREGVKWHDGSPLTAQDVAASWLKIVSAAGRSRPARARAITSWSTRSRRPDPRTVVFRLKYPTSVFLPALADPFTYIYKKEILDKDPRWYEKNIMGSGPFKIVNYEAGQAIKGERNPDYYHKGLPYLDGIIGILAPKQATRLDAIRADRGAIEFRSLPPSARDELVNSLGDKITVQEQRLELRPLIGTPNHKKKPFDDVRVRRALTLAIDRWGMARRRYRKSRSCRPSAASSSPARRSPPPRRSWSRSPASGPTSRSRAPRQAAC